MGIVLLPAPQALVRVNIFKDGSREATIIIII